jgi:hypothetical protein
MRLWATASRSGRTTPVDVVEGLGMVAVDVDADLVERGDGKTVDARSARTPTEST